MRGRFVPLVPQRLPRSQVKSISGPAASCTGDFYHSREMRSSGSGVGGDAHHLWTAEGRSGSRRFQQLANAGYQLISAEGLLEIIQAGEIQAVILASLRPDTECHKQCAQIRLLFSNGNRQSAPVPIRQRNTRDEQFDCAPVPLATSRRRTCSPAVSRRSMPSEIGSWRRRENSVKFVGSRPRKQGADRPFSVVAGTSKHHAVASGSRFGLDDNC